ncbi:MAG: hypothetical protein A3D10_04245 [Omnitrophica WOR_2 bacterium RIFCSPHIGHO2_02_FULL_48_11]|nr:MAG: hypothetical protein A3D10_04245 [Omnitrophica WOR_2 bacterium RIFCSPHIGHO2_02_FULL_48_11]
MSSTSCRISMKIAKLRIRNFRDEVWRYWKKHGRRKLAWRKTRNPYRILVSEVMLQQTQVLRVITKYKEFLKEFPTVQKLARAPLGSVLKVWSGMGYNRRAKYLRDAAGIIVGKHKGRVPKDEAVLRALPGVGPYTARAVRVFAFNEPDVLIETNIRAAFIHLFYPSVLQNTGIEDSKILLIAAAAAEGQNPREWHWALMDYGVHIKKLHKNPARKSAHYTKQSKFEGSLRQVRGAILKSILKDIPHIDLRGRYGKKYEAALTSLSKDGLILKKKGLWKV